LHITYYLIFYDVFDPFVCAFSLFERLKISDCQIGFRDMMRPNWKCLVY